MYDHMVMIYGRETIYVIGYEKVVLSGNQWCMSSFIVMIGSVMS